MLNGPEQRNWSESEYIRWQTRTCMTLVSLDICVPLFAVLHGLYWPPLASLGTLHSLSVSTLLCAQMPSVWRVYASMPLGHVCVSILRDGAKAGPVEAHYTVRCLMPICFPGLSMCYPMCLMIGAFRLKEREVQVPGGLCSGVPSHAEGQNPSAPKCQAPKQAV